MAPAAPASAPCPLHSAERWNGRVLPARRRLQVRVVRAEGVVECVLLYLDSRLAVPAVEDSEGFWFYTRGFDGEYSHLGIRDLSSRALEGRRCDGDTALQDDIFVPAQNIRNAVGVDQADVADFTRASTLEAAEIEASSCASRATSNVILSGAAQ